MVPPINGQREMEMMFSQGCQSATLGYWQLHLPKT